MKFHKAKPGSGHPSGAEARGIPGRVTASMRGGTAACLLAACLLCVLPAQAAQKSKTRVELLIARNEVNDPFFHHSVVLMLPTLETQLIVGVIINKPTRVALGRLFPNSPAFENKTDRAYFGGPVGVRTPSIIFRSSTAPEKAVRLYGNVYLTFDADLITSAFQGTQGASARRLYLGRAQWSPNQLQNEIRRGSWYRIKAEGDLVFSPHPEDLWRTLHARAAPSKYIRYNLPARNAHPSTSSSAAM